MLTEQRVSDPFRGLQEFLLNSGMDRDGLRHRVCLHPDRTVRDTEDGTLLECDYCPTGRMLLPGMLLELPAWYWREP